MSQEWNIQSRGEACTACDEPFSDRQAYHTQLRFGTEGYTRVDLCETCRAQASDKDVLSSWQGIFKMPPPKPEEPLKKENAESLLRKFMEDDDPAKCNAVYILAVMLERKKLLVEKEVQQDDADVKVRIYEHKGTGETFLVPDPQLKLSDIENVQQEVVALLEGKPVENTEKPAGPAAS